MSLNTKGESCVRCQAYLFPEDDVVYCPVCGAPHHRECYNELGHCALEQFHGTDKQYDKVKAAERERAEENGGTPEPEEVDGRITCRMCHEKYDFSLNFCPKCGAPNIAKAGGSFESFDFLGGVPADYDIGDGVTADEAKRFVAVNTRRYIPKFAVLNRKNRSSWNWAAFLFPYGWALSRKMYKTGIVSGLLAVNSSLLYLPITRVLYNAGLADAENYVQAADGVSQNLPKLGLGILIAAAIGFLLNMAVRFVLGVLGDYFYKNYTVDSIKKIRAESEDMDNDYRKKGGVNIFLFLIGTLAVQYLPAITAAFIM